MGLLHLRHCHVFPTRHDRYAARECIGRKYVGGMAFGCPASRANDVVFEPGTVRREICCGAFLERVVCADHGNWKFVTSSAARQTNDRRFVDSPTFEMRQFKTGGDLVGTTLG